MVAIIKGKPVRVKRDKFFGLHEDDREGLFHMLSRVFEIIRSDDRRGRARKFALFVFTDEGDTDGGEGCIITTDVLGDMERENVHSLLRDWLHKETQ